jgi:flagellar hook-associated protein 1 FlgK
MGLAINEAATKYFREAPVALNGILSSALTAMQTNTSALKVVSQNISNLNTANYARREVNLSALGAAGIPSGVTIEDVTRVTNQYLTQECLAASSSSSQYDTASSFYDQINALLGSPGDGNSLTSKISDVLGKLASAQLSTNVGSSQASIVSSLKSLTSSVSTISSSLDNMATQADSQLATTVTGASTLIKQIYDYNNLIKAATLQGNTDTAYLDQRDTALKNLSADMDIRVTPQSDGTVQVTTTDGIGLVGTGSYSVLSYKPGTGTGYGTISVQDTNGNTGQPIGTVQSLDSHLTAGSMRGLIDLRDTTIAGIQNELGSLAKGMANAFNEIHNESSAYPPPTELTGHNTGLLASDSLGFTGKSEFVLTNSSGVKQHTIDFNFDNAPPSFSVDGGAASTFTATVGGFATALNGALSGLGGGGSASFANGVLSVDGGSYGVVVGDADSTHPSSRGGAGLSQFFGLNDLLTTSVPSFSNTGMSATDALGLAANGEIKFTVKNPNGSVATSAAVTITTGMTVGQAITAINTSLGGYASVSLDANGAMTTTVNTNYPGYSLQVTDDSTARGTTGISVSDLFGLGANAISRLSSGFTVNADIASSPSRLAFAKPNLSPTATQIVGSGDSTGLQALQALASKEVSFDKVANLGAQTTSLQNYAAALYQDIATQSANNTTAKTTQDDRLTEAQARLSNNSGVNLDEELANMIIYQRAYSAGARLLTTVNQLYDSLLSIQ